MIDTIDIDKFTAVDIRIGTIVEVTPFPEARKPAWKLSIDLGAEIGIKRSSAQITDLYAQEALVGTQTTPDALCWFGPSDPFQTADGFISGRHPRRPVP